MVALTLFDLDHTLLDGDSDVLWCEFLMDRGVLDRADFGARNAAMDRDYRAGTVSAQDFCAFYVSTLAGRSIDAWQPLRRAFLDEVVAPRIKPGTRALVQRHAEAGELLVMTTATNRFITELTAAHLGLPHLIATECERAGDGFSGRPTGTLNMREGKLARLQVWLEERHIRFDECDSTLYSDSINDLPLMAAVRRPVAVDPDARLQAEAAVRGWPVISLRH
jgi:HAD superfamily hydrolase (TIGR01490 family)